MIPADPFSALVLLQQFDPEAGAREKSQGTEWFFDVWLWVLIIVPTLVVILLAASRRKRTPAPPEVLAGNWDEEVIESPLPVVVHVFSKWSVGDRVIEKQVEQLGEKAGGRLKVLWLDIERNSALLEVYPTLEKQSVALFLKGRLLWQSLGVQGHEQMLEEIEEALSRA